MDRLTAMEAFVRVADAGSFSAAARQWGRSKAVVSKQVAALEARLGFALLHRTTRSLSLTTAGRAYHERCRELLEEVDALEASLGPNSDNLHGTLRVTAPPGFASAHLRQMTTDFTSRHPAVTLDLDVTYRMVDLAAEGIDVALRITNPQDSALIARRIGPVPIVAVASPDYLADRGTPRVPADLRQHACLVDTNFRDQQRWRFRGASGPETVVVDGPVRANTPAITRALAVAGQGVTLVPQFMVAEDLKAGRLVEVLRGQVVLRWTIMAVYHRRRHLTPRVRAYVDHLASALSLPPG